MTVHVRQSPDSHSCSVYTAYIPSTSSGRNLFVDIDLDIGAAFDTFDSYTTQVQHHALRSNKLGVLVCYRPVQLF